MMMQSIDRWIYSQIAYPKLDVIYKCKRVLIKRNVSGFLLGCAVWEQGCPKQSELLTLQGRPKNTHSCENSSRSLEISRVLEAHGQHLKRGLYSAFNLHF